MTPSKDMHSYKGDYVHEITVKDFTIQNSSSIQLLRNRINYFEKELRKTDHYLEFKVPFAILQTAGKIRYMVSFLY